MNKLALIFCLTLVSCASTNYKNSKKWKKNNTITIKSENLNQFSIYIEGENIGTKQVDESNIVVTKYRKNNHPNDLKRLITVNSPSAFYNVTFDGFKKKNIKLSLLNENYEKIDLTIQKRVRYDALTKDIILSVFTFGLPLIIDPFKSDFYKIKENSVNQKIKFEYTQYFMKGEYSKIYNSNNIQDFENWIARYSKSNLLNNVIDHKDSLEYSYALAEQKESIMDAFISTHNKSKYLDSAIAVKNEMKSAREMFELSKTNNTVIGYEEYLKKYPNSLNNKEAHTLLLNAAEREAIATSSSEKMVLFIKNYFIPNIKLIETNSLSARQKNIRNNLEDFIIKEALQNNQDNKYENYRLLWTNYSTICKDNKIPRELKNFDKIKKYQVEICDYLFNTLQIANTQEKQSIWMRKTLDDFPELDLVDNFPSKSKDLLLTVIETQKNGTGKILVFNSNILSKFTSNSKIDNGLIEKYNNGKYQYQGNTFDALANCNYLELNFAKGILNGMNKAFKDKQLQFSIDANKDNEITDEISYYKDGKLLKTIYISKGFTADGECIVNKDFAYEFENGVNLTLINFEKEITKLENESKNYINPLDHKTAIIECNRLKKYNIPDKVQNARIEKVLATAENSIKSFGNSNVEALNRAKLRYNDENNINRKTENSDLSKNIKSIFCYTMKGEKFKVILYESGECDYVLFNIFGEIQKSLSGKWTMRNLGVYGGWTTLISFEHGSSTFKCQMNGSGDIQALIDDQGNFWLKCN